MCFIACSLMNEVVHTSPTIGSNVEEVIWKNIHFLMWDIGGQESLRSAWNTYFTNSEVSLHQTFVGYQHREKSGYGRPFDTVDIFNFDEFMNVTLQDSVQIKFDLDIFTNNTNIVQIISFSMNSNYFNN